MSIQFGIPDETTTSRYIRTFNSERIHLYSDVQSNLLDLVSGCNVTSLSFSNINTQASVYIGSSNQNSNLTIVSYRNGNNPYSILDISKNQTNINTENCVFSGDVNIAGNMKIDGNLEANIKINPITEGILANNISIYSLSNNYKPFSIRPTTDIHDIISLNTNSNNFIIGQPLSPYQPNVGIGTTIARYKLHTQGPIHGSDGIYTKFISSNLSSPNIGYYGNLNVNGSLTISGNFDLAGAKINITNMTITSINSSKPGIYVSQQTGSNSLVQIKLDSGTGTSNTIFGISPYGHTYIGSDMLDSSNMSLYERSSLSNAMLNIYIPQSFTNDSLIKTTSYDTSNTLILSKDAYIGIGTTIIRNPLQLYFNSYSNTHDYALSNIIPINIYHMNMPNKDVLYASSNNIPVFSIDGRGGVNIGSNNMIQFVSNGNAIINNTIYINTLQLLNQGIAIETNNSRLSNFGNIQTLSLIGSNINTSNISTSNITNIANLATSNISLNNINVNTNGLFNDFYINGTLNGPNINIYLGQSDRTYFIPAASGANSLSYFKTSNVLISINSNYTDELTNAIAGSSNGILQIYTYKINNNPITPGISVYGHTHSSILVSSSNPYYQLQRPYRTPYNIGIDRNNDLCVGLSNGTNALDYTSTQLKVHTDGMTSMGNTKTILYSRPNSAIYVSTVDANPVISSSGGFETRGITYFRSSNSSKGLYIDNTTNVGIGTTIPKVKVDVQGDVIISNNLEIGNSVVFFNKNIGIGTTILRSKLDIIGDAIISKNIGIGTTLPRFNLDILGTILISSNLGIGVTNTGVYSLNISSNMAVTSSFTASNTITAQNIYGNLQGVANSAIVSSNAPSLINIPNIITVGTISSTSITNTNTINAGTSIVFANTIIGSNINTSNSLRTINITSTGIFSVKNFTVDGSNIPINPYLSLNSNLLIKNNTGTGPGLAIYQSGSGSSYHVADFYDTIDTTVPVLRIADGGNIGLGTTIPISKLHVHGSGYFSCNVGIGTTLPIYPLHIQGNCYFSGNIGIGTTIPLANLHHAGNGEVIIPELTGMILHFATPNAPNGWLKCNGAAVNRASYSNLFAMINTTYGSGNGSTTFNVPDLRGVFIRGWADNNLTYDVGRSWSSAIQIDDYKQHIHDSWKTNNFNFSYEGGGTTRDYAASDPFIVSSGYPNFGGGVDTRPVNMAFLACIKY